MEKYTLIKRIGSGSYGTAFLGKEKASGDLYVFKEIDARQLSRAEVKKIALEIKVLSSMNHEFIVRYHDYCKHDGNIYIIMRYCPGGDMHERIKLQGRSPFPIEQVYKWFLQTALVLHYLHQKKVIHRDIKPQNLFLDENSNIKVGDFGISRVLQFTQDMAQTAVGTPLYVAPEVVKGMPYDSRADVWSMGCTFYEILTLTPPFTGLSMSDLMCRVKAGVFQRIDNHFDCDLRTIIHSMLEVDPRKRPTIEDILMQPCLLSRLHQYYPQYVPTLFPYTTPSVDTPSQVPSVSSGKNSSASKLTRVSSSTSPTKITHVSSTLSNSSKNERKSAARSSPAVILHRVKRSMSNGSEFDLSTDGSSVSAVSTVRRASMPAKPIEVRSIHHRTRSSGISAYSRQTPAVEMVNEHTEPSAQKRASSSNSSGSKITRYNVNPTSIQPMEQTASQPIRAASPSVRPVVPSVPNKEAPEKKKISIQPIPILTGVNKQFKWRVPKKQDVLRHDSELGQLRGIYEYNHQ